MVSHVTSAFEAAESKVRSSIEATLAAVAKDSRLDSLLSKAESGQDGPTASSAQVSDLLLVEENGPSEDSLDEH